MASRSAAEVAVGRLPLRRLEIPGTISTERPTFVVAERGKPVAFAPDGSVTLVRSESDAISVLRLIGTASTPDPLADGVVKGIKSVCFADRAARLAFTRAFAGRSALSPGRRINYLARCEFPSVADVLTAALDRKFHAPTGMRVGELAEWARLVGGSKDCYDPRVLGSLWILAGGGSTDDARMGRFATFARRSAALERILSAGNPSDSFRSAVSVAELWGFLVRTDPLGRDEATLKGEVAKLTGPAKLAGGIVEIPVATPFKVRNGDVRVFDAAGRNSRAELIGTGYTEDGLVARFTAPVGTSRRASSFAGYRALCDVSPESPLWVTDPSFDKSPSSSRGKWTRRPKAVETPAPTAKRDVPLYVAMAGAGD